MSNLNTKTKTDWTIIEGPKDKIEGYLNALHKSIDFYLCRAPYQAINQEQAGNIYFIKCFIRGTKIKEVTPWHFALDFELMESDKILIHEIMVSLEAISTEILKDQSSSDRLDLDLSFSAYSIMELKRALSELPIYDSREVYLI
ncbi:MAG: hypothetical protein NXH89_00635 [Cyclobacteriaceae bacterium]|nr:hypothetical protein [Cyclobacteriaceae bacterium]